MTEKHPGQNPDQNGEFNFGIYQEKTDKLRELDEEGIKENEKKKLDFKLDKEKLTKTIESSREVTFLKSMMERWQISPELAKVIAQNDQLESEEIEEIFEKIEEIEAAWDKVLPKELRLTKTEYLTALSDEWAKEEALQKLENALVHIYKQMHGDDVSPLAFIFSFFWFLNQNLITTQENTIDIKRSLEDK